MIKLDYFDCISPLPLELTNVGKIKSPKLIDVAKISYYTYSLYIAYLKMTPEEYFEIYHRRGKSLRFPRRTGSGRPGTGGKRTHHSGNGSSVYGGGFLPYEKRSFI